MRMTKEEKVSALKMREDGKSGRFIAKQLLGRKSRQSTIYDFFKRADAGLENETVSFVKNNAKILFIDIETAPVFGAVWSLWQQNVGLNQIKNDWFILSYAAKWAGSGKVMYSDVSANINEEDDTSLLDEMWCLLNEADIVVGHNLKKFDIKKINARLILNGYKPPSSYKMVDTLQIAKSKFAFTSNKLEYLTDKLCVEYKKLKHSKFAGFDLWKQCLLGNKEAWAEMKKYNKYDVLSLEELYNKLIGWDSKHPNLSHFTDLNQMSCDCGSTNLHESGIHRTQVSEFTKYQCRDCGAEYRGRSNGFTSEQRKNILIRL